MDSIEDKQTLLKEYLSEYDTKNMLAFVKLHIQSIDLKNTG